MNKQEAITALRADGNAESRPADWLERRESVKADVNAEDGRIAEPKEDV